MTKTWDEMKPRERDVLTAERVMGITVFYLTSPRVLFYGVDGIDRPCDAGEPYELSGMDGKTPMPLPFFSQDIRACRLIDDVIEQRGVQQRYIEELASLRGCPGSRATMPTIWSWDGLWCVMRASPADRCRAALRAMGVAV